MKGHKAYGIQNFAGVMRADAAIQQLAEVGNQVDGALVFESVQEVAHLLQVLDRDEEALTILEEADQHTESGPLAAQLADSLTTPSQCAMRGESLAAVRLLVERLDPIDREVLVLRHLEELSNTEVAQVLGIDKFAASKRYLRALARLRSLMPAEA